MTNIFEEFVSLEKTTLNPDIVCFLDNLRKKCSKQKNVKFSKSFLSSMLLFLEKAIIKSNEGEKDIEFCEEIRIKYNGIWLFSRIFGENEQKIFEKSLFKPILTNILNSLSSNYYEIVEISLVALAKISSANAKYRDFIISSPKINNVNKINSALSKLKYLDNTPNHEKSGRSIILKNLSQLLEVLLTTKPRPPVPQILIFFHCLSELLFEENEKTLESVLNIWKTITLNSGEKETQIFISNGLLQKIMTILIKTFEKKKYKY